MSEKEEAVRALNLFNEKAEELLSSTFTNKVFDEGTSVTLQWNWETEEEKNNFERIGPNKEDIKAFIIDFRFFIQDNERSSFRNLKKIYSSNLLKAKFETRFDSARDRLNNFLDLPSNLHASNGTTFTHRQITDTFIYGGIAHANEEKEQLFKKWQKSSFFLLIENRFISCLMEILNVINFTKNLNAEALKELETI